MQFGGSSKETSISLSNLLLGSLERYCVEKAGDNFVAIDRVLSGIEALATAYALTHTNRPRIVLLNPDMCSLAGSYANSG